MCADNYQTLILSVTVMLLGACAGTALAASTPLAAAAPLKSGIETQYLDPSVRAQDDFYRHVNGKWLASTEIPPDRAVWGSYATLRDTVTGQLRGLIESAAKNSTDADERKIADLYASFMDEARLEELGATPLAAELARVAALTDKRDIPAEIARLNRIGATAPYQLYVTQDDQDPGQYTVLLDQDGLGLPDRDYYLADDAKFKDIRVKYLAHLQTMLALIGDRRAAQDAKAVMALETALAQAQWTKVENRDPIKTYNKLAISNLGVLIPGYDWKAYFSAAGVEGRVEHVVVDQPGYVQTFGKILKETPLPVWRAYFDWALVAEAAPYLSKRFVDAQFAFYGTVLKGVPENLPRWKRGVAFVDDAIGEGLGRLYVTRYFPPSSKERIEALVGNLIAAYRTRIDSLDWMDPQTKRQAQNKLAKLEVKIGNPVKWRDYASLQVAPGDLFGNLTRSHEFEYQRDLNKLGGPIDRNEWLMTPQTVNAYYYGEKNEIVFPAAYLQPLDFQADADDAANYGGIGATIGHEISHGFDDEGSQYDADGKLRNWWTAEDRAHYAAKTRAMVAEYDAFEPIPGFHVNGALTLGENIADNAGVTIAYQAYRASLGGHEAPIIDGLTGDQRFFMSLAQSYRIVERPDEELVSLKSDPHTPDEYRVRGVLVNQPAFYAAFGIKEGDAMYVPPEKRIAIW